MERSPDMVHSTKIFAIGIITVDNSHKIAASFFLKSISVVPASVLDDRKPREQNRSSALGASAICIQYVNGCSRGLNCSLILKHESQVWFGPPHGTTNRFIEIASFGKMLHQPNSVCSAM